MKSKVKFTSVILVLTLLASLLAVMPAFAAVRGGAAVLDPSDTTKTLSWAMRGGDIVLEVRDADLDVAATIAAETLEFTACPASELGGELRQDKVDNVPIVDKTGDGIVNFQDVTLGTGSDAGTSVWTVDGVNGIVTLRCAAASTSATQVVTYKAASANFAGTAETPHSASVVKVTSDGDQAGIGVVLTETTVSSGIFRATLTLTSGDSTSTTPALNVGATDVVTLSYTDSSPTPTTTVTATVNVETTGPSVTNFSPANAVGTQIVRPEVSGDVTDADSLVKKTSLLVVFGVDTDLDNDIDVVAAVDPNSFGDVTAITGGYHVTQRLPAAQQPSGDAQVFWWVQGLDNAGNTGVTDRQTTISGAADACDPAAFAAISNLVGVDVTSSAAVKGCQPYMVKVDFTNPDMASATTGPWWDTTKTTTDKTETAPTKAKNTSIIVDFNEAIDGTTVQPSDFTVAAVVPSAAQHFSDKASSVFLTVSTMASNAKPVVKLVGEVKDPAGNPLTIDEVTSADGIAPTITVAVTGTGTTGTIPVTKDKVTIQFSTDEAATVDANSVVVEPAATATTLGGSVGTLTPVLVSAQTWKVEVTPGAAGLFNAYVTLRDLAANQGTKGHISDPSNTAALLFEKDTGIPTPTFTPATTTDDTSPSLLVDFASEGREYGLAANGTFTTTLANVVTDKDSHNTVTLVSASLDDTSITPVTRDNIKFEYAASGLSLGNHTLKIKVKDEAGNEVEFTNTFKVTARAGLTINLSRGMNLASIPQEPVQPGINDVFGAASGVDLVMTYDPTLGATLGERWLISQRDSTTGLFGADQDIQVIERGKAYWVQSDGVRSVAVLTQRPTAAPGEVPPVPPSITVVGGEWNLVGFISIADPPPAAVDADDYFAGVKWTVAYGYDPLTGWSAAIRPNPTTTGEDNIAAFKGYYVFATADGWIAP